MQFVKFSLLRISSTLISHGIELLIYYVWSTCVPWIDQTRIAVTSALAFMVSVTNMYYWNICYFFGNGEKMAVQHLCPTEKQLPAME